MMLRYSFGLEKEANDIENAVRRFLADGYRTKDIAAEGEKTVGCREAGRIIRSYI